MNSFVPLPGNTASLFPRSGWSQGMDRTRVLPRSLQIAFALGGFVWAWFRLHKKSPQ